MLEHVLTSARYRDHDLFVFGQSLGGSVALPAIVAELAGLQPRLKGVVVEGSFDEYRRVACSKVEQYWLGWLVSAPLGWLLISSGFEPIEAAAQLALPIVFVHATGDALVPIECGERLFAASAAQDKQLWRIDSAQHLAVFADAASPLRRRLLRWLTAH